MLGGMRMMAGLLLAGMAVILAMPEEFLPSVARWRAARGLVGWWWPCVVAGCLGIAAMLLPRCRPRTAPTYDLTGATVALVLLCEPGLHLLLLAVSSVVATPTGAEALLPLAAPALGSELVVLLIAYAVVVPIGEELFFRGRLLAWLGQRLGRISAVSISAGLFAVAHGDLVQVLFALPLGLILGGMRVAGASLGACIIAHAVHNGLFLLAGPGLVGLPVATPLLVVAGALLAGFSWHFHIRPRPHPFRRLGMTSLLAAVIVLVCAPWWRALQDGWWSAGVHRLCVRWRIDTADLLARMMAQERRNRLTPVRQHQVTVTLLAEPCQTSYRQVGLVALLAPEHIAAVDGWEDAGYELFEHLAARPPARYDGDLARRLAPTLSSAFADTILQWPELLERWLPLPERTADAAAIVASCAAVRDRRVLLAQMEVCYPGHVTAVILAMPISTLTATESRHLRLHQADVEGWMTHLADHDPLRAQALGWQP